MKYQKEFERLKLQKLQARHAKHGENSVLNPHAKLPPFNVLHAHFKEESRELDQAIKQKDPENILEELADISNMVDMMFDACFLEKVKQT